LNWLQGYHSGVLIGVPVSYLGGATKYLADREPGTVLLGVRRSLATLWAVIFSRLRWLPGLPFDIGSEPPGGVTGLYTLDALLVACGCSSTRSVILSCPAPCWKLQHGPHCPHHSLNLDVLSRITCATRSKGLAGVILQHAFPNALIPTVTVLGLSYGNLLSGTVLTEKIFSWPGIGQYAYQASVSLDFPAIMGVTMLIALIFIAANLIVDITYIFLDPRLREA
jgi:peptide/nickel transport system permease protein